MIKPPIARPNDDLKTVGRIFSTPLVVKGWSWLPLAQLVAWPIMTRAAQKRVPERSLGESIGVGALTTIIMLGSEWCHNVAHAAAARLVGKPIDAIRIIFGMPLLVYYDINDPSVTPKQHIARALGGPVFNLVALPFALLWKKCTPEKSVARDAAGVAAGTNAFLPAVGMLPIPGIDGGPVLKWSLVEKGATIEEADQVVRKVDGVLGGLFAAASWTAFGKRRIWIGALLAQFALLCLSIALGLFKEQD